jgi:hypothetical protein
VEEHCSNLQCFKEKNYKAKFSTNSILKKKINEYNFEQNHKKNHVGKHRSNLQYFMRKVTTVIHN